MTRRGHDLAGGSTVTTDACFDRAERNRSPALRDLVDSAMQHDMPLHGRHKFTWGCGFRTRGHRTQGVHELELRPATGNEELLNAFAQDEIGVVPDRLHLTPGLRLERSSLVDREQPQPGARLAWNVDERGVPWGAASHANPREYRRTIVTSGVVTCLPDAVVPTSLGCSTTFGNTGTANGVEPATAWRPSPEWRVQAGASYADIEIRRDSAGGSVPQSSLSDGTSPLHQGSLRVSGDLTGRIQLDMAARCVDALATFATPAYTAVEARLGWRAVRKLGLSPIGRNLFDSRHTEFGTDPDPLGGGNPAFVHAQSDGGVLTR